MAEVTKRAEKVENSTILVGDIPCLFIMFLDFHIPESCIIIFLVVPHLVEWILTNFGIMGLRARVGESEGFKMKMAA